MWENSLVLRLAFLILLKNKISFVLGFYTAFFFSYPVIALSCNKYYKCIVVPL